MALYSETVMDHFRNSRNVGVIEDADGVGEAGNAVCGEVAVSVGVGGVGAARSGGFLTGRLELGGGQGAQHGGGQHSGLPVL